MTKRNIDGDSGDITRFNFNAPLQDSRNPTNDKFLRYTTECSAAARHQWEREDPFASTASVYEDKEGALRPVPYDARFIPRVANVPTMSCLFAIGPSSSESCLVVYDPWFVHNRRVFTVLCILRHANSPYSRYVNRDIAKYIMTLAGLLLDPIDLSHVTLRLGGGATLFYSTATQQWVPTVKGIKMQEDMDNACRVCSRPFSAWTGCRVHGLGPNRCEACHVYPVMPHENYCESCNQKCAVKDYYDDFGYPYDDDDMQEIQEDYEMRRMFDYFHDGEKDN